ncbi:MAG TPA: GWxTD domain-containing protein [Bacteroidales bacterium]|nr:GWxTD domain-containing protein [Bacteroidales bacterium]
MNRRLFSLTLLVLMLWLQACQLPQRSRRPAGNTADVYNPARVTIHPDFLINHINDSTSVLYIRIFPAELLFNQANEQGRFLAKLKVGFVLEEKTQGGHNNVIDSASVVRTLNRSEMRNSFFTALPLKALFGNRYMVKVSIEDILRGTVSEHYLLVDKTTPFGAQNFRVISASTGYPSFTMDFKTGEKFRILFNRMGYDSLYVDYYKPDQSLPRPIFSTAPEVPVPSYPDSVWTLPFNDSSLYELPKRGIYHFRLTTDHKEGLSLFNFGEDFPRVQSPDNLLGPLVYLTYSAEFRDLRMEPNRKLAIDNFWLKLAGSMDAARELIRVFYNRVLYTNLYFTSYKEGWKTDRGMIYIIFGPPNLLDKSLNVEKWTYFTRRGNTPIEFVFDRENNLFTYKDFVLNRNISSTGYWSDAVRSWKRGKIYSPEY